MVLNLEYVIVVVDFFVGVFSTFGARGVDKMEDCYIVVNNFGGCVYVYFVVVFDGY